MGLGTTDDSDRGQSEEPLYGAFLCRDGLDEAN